MEQKNGRMALIVAGVGEIIIAVATFVFIRILLASGEAQSLHNITVDASALGNLALLYLLCAFKLLVGALAIAFSGKPAKGKLLMVIGCLLVVFAMSGLSYGGSAEMWIANSITLLVPGIYIYGAQKNIKLAVNK